MPLFDVTVTVTLADGHSFEDAEIDARDDLGDHNYHIEDTSPQAAEALALDLFHGTVAIGALEAVEIDVKVQEARPGSPETYLDSAAVIKTIRDRWHQDRDQNLEEP
jgi:hypothetical protein